MYFKHENPIAKRSQQMISDALFLLMKSVPFSQITVTEICDAAGIGRKTFYRNFEMKEDIITYQLDKLHDEFQIKCTADSFDAFLRLYLDFHQKHMDYLALLYKNGLAIYVADRFAYLRNEMMPQWPDDPVVQEYKSNYVYTGFQAIVYTWVIRGFSESIDTVISIIHQIFDS